MGVSQCHKMQVMNYTIIILIITVIIFILSLKKKRN